MEGANNTTAWSQFENSSNKTPKLEDEEVKLSYQVGTSFLLGALILCAIFGNACVVAAIALERSLQNVANYLIGSLAVTDLMVSVLVLPMAALYQVLNRWTLGQIPCDIFISLDVLCCTSSILHLCAIALDRYWAITEPIEYMKKRTPRRAAVLIGVTWLVGFSISVPPMLIMRSQPGSMAEDRANPKQCKIRQDPWYTIYSTFGAFYIPLTLMLVLYGRIFKAARFRIRRTVRKTEKKKVADSCLALSPALFHKKTPGDAQGKSWKRSVEPRPLASVNGAVKHAEDGESLEIIEHPEPPCTLILLWIRCISVLIVKTKTIRVAGLSFKGGDGDTESVPDVVEKTDRHTILPVHERSQKELLLKWSGCFSTLSSVTHSLMSNKSS
ncbi:hypothetical protein FQN60_008436 [Etheostoma spectabile]|uniref:G-protein coupled receptors family 1 profile domain-containing protein n=1 Tax=Etheostoma spectabile TaxID=54343 RepID=A0A5J5CZ95_9PERO|nr:hypothetical protein FQN60_008436 [Etheostoma spectabile]